MPEQEDVAEDPHSLGRAVLAAEARWVTETVSQLRSGQLTWSPGELLAFAEGQ